MDKYYTPEIEELHIGFVLECFVDAVKSWRSFDIKNGKHLDFLINQIIRVKYLSKEDIESLGWIIDKVREGKNQELYFKDNIVLYYRYETKELGIFTRDPSKNEYYSVHNVDPHRIQSLVIKNKSELIKLLKQLNIG